MTPQPKPTVRIAGVNDEPSPTWDLDEGLDVLDELGIKFIELRAAHGKMVDQMDDEMFYPIADRVKERGFTVTTYLGQVGRDIPNKEIRKRDLEWIERAIKRADYIGTNQLRTMGYKKGEEDGTDWFSRAVWMYKDMTALAAAANKTIVFENPPGHNAAVCWAPECLEALQAVNSPIFVSTLTPETLAHTVRLVFNSLNNSKITLATYTSKTFSNPAIPAPTASPVTANVNTPKYSNALPKWGMPVRSQPNPISYTKKNFMSRAAKIISLPSTALSSY